MNDQTANMGDAIDAAIRTIYAAALDAKRWPDAVAQVVQACGASSATLVTPGPTMSRQLMYAHNLDPDGILAYEQHWYSRDEWTLRGLRVHGMRAGASSIGDQLIAPADFMRTAFGHDFAHRFEIDQVLGAMLFDDTTPAVAPSTMLSVFRGATEPRFQEHEHQRLRRLIPHFQRAIEIHWRLHREGQQRELTGEAFDALDDALFLLTRSGGIAHTNARATAMLRDPQCVAVHNNRIERLGRRSLPAIHEAVARAAHTGALVPLLVESEGHPSRLMRGSVQPLPADNPIALPDQPALLLIVQLPREPSPDLLQQVGRLYGFTPAEQRVAMLLLEGRSNAEAAAALELRTSTVKTHIASLLAKGGYRRAIDLVRALSSLG